MNKAMWYKKIADQLKAAGDTVTSWPVCIPSYSRPEAGLLKEIKTRQGTEFILFIRETQVNMYAEYLGLCTIVPLCNVTDIGTTRAAITDWLHEHRYKHAFILDDDITSFDYLYPHPTRNGTYSMRSSRLNEGVKTGFNHFALRVLEEAITLITTNRPIAMAGIPLRQFSWTIPERAYRLDRDLPIQFIYLNIELLYSSPVRYESNKIVGWEDFALVYKLRKHGCHIAYLYGFSYACPAMGSNTGGIQALSDDSDYLQRCRKYCERFDANVAMGDPCIYTKIYGKRQVPNTRCNWKTLKTYEEEQNEGIS